MSEDALQLRNVGFSYPGGTAVLDGVSLSVQQGEFVLLTGATGMGKTTLLRLCKPEVAPHGKLSGEILLFGQPARSLDAQASAQTVGYVFQSPQNQIVCDTVWHEMAFGLENLGVSEGLMRLRIAETCYFLGIEPWFERKTAELSGGQRQVLALAATLVMRPRLLLLDEPTSMLDPIAEKNFLSLLRRVNIELGITVVLATHSPERMAEYATRTIALGEQFPATVTMPQMQSRAHGSSEVACVRDAWFRYGRTDPWVLRGVNLSVEEGTCHALVGGNGCGKSTLLGMVAQAVRPARGKVSNRHAKSLGLLPQSPKALLSCETVEAELMAWSQSSGYGREQMDDLCERIGLGGDARIMKRHPYDLSGGQQQLLACAKLILARPQMLLLDEPTKGLDPNVRAALARLLFDVLQDGATVLVATHDMGFVRSMCNEVSLLFDGQVSCTLPCEEFFASTQFFGM